MDFQITLLLGQDGLVNGAVYGLLALALVLVFSVTRIIFIPQGELVAFGALTMAALTAGRTPATLWLLLALAAATLAVEGWRFVKGEKVEWISTLTWTVISPAAASALLLLPLSGVGTQSLATILLVTPLGPLLYRLAYRPIADGTVLHLLIVSVAVHGALVGLGLLFFGAEGSRTPSLLDTNLELAGLTIPGQAIVVLASAAVMVVVLFLFFERSILGKALRATASNRVGARLMGIPTELSADISFAIAALIGAISGLLVAPLATIYYDTGFLIGLKGFVAAIIGGLASYPMAFAGALLVGQLESFSSFWASSLKEVIVFTLIVPVLLWRSLRSHHMEDEG